MPIDTQEDFDAHAAPKLPAQWHALVRSQLNGGEAPLAWLELNLDAQLRFAEGLLVLTEGRLLAWQDGAWQQWPLRADLTLRQTDHAGVGALELHDRQARLAIWRYTLGHHRLAMRFIADFQQASEAWSGREANTVALPLAGDQPVFPSPPSTWALLRLTRFARPYRRQLLAGFLLTLTSTGAALVAPYLTMPLMDKVLIPFQNGQPIDYGLVRLYLGGLLASALLAWILGWGRTYILARVSERIGADLRVATYKHLQTLSLQYFGGKRTGDLIARIGSESDRICVFLSLHLLDFATDVLMIIMTAVILFTINPWLALVTLLPVPFIIWLIQLVRTRLRHGFERADRAWSELTSVLADTIPGIRVVKAFAQEHREVLRFRRANQRNLAVNDKVNAVWSLFSPSVSFLTEVGLLVVWGFGIWLVAGSEITVGVLTAFIAYIGRFYTRLDSMSRIVSFTQKAAAGAKRIFDILDQVSTVPEPTNPVHLEDVKGHIQLHHVGFRYGHRNVIKDLSLDIEPGEMIGLVGHSGSGKSTLINLICRFYDVTEGSICIDGVDIRSIPVSEYRGQIGLVLQEPFLFFGTVAENIAYGKPDATPEEIIAAARAADAHEFILRLPHAYDSLVGERGQALSGGERQRISIARALLIDPRILILDEATSSVDTATEKEIQKALDNLVQGRTTISIAHRLSTLHKADRLVVLDRGHIVEVGPHYELLARDGPYSRLYRAQEQREASSGSPAPDDEPASQRSAKELEDHIDERLAEGLGERLESEARAMEQSQALEKELP